MISIPVLETPRLLLRQFQQNDFAALAALSADPEVMKFLGDGKPKARAETWLAMASYLGHWELRGYGLWAVEEKATGKFVDESGCSIPRDGPGWKSRGRSRATDGATASPPRARRRRWTTLSRSSSL